MDPATLSDAAEALQEALDKLEEHPDEETAEYILKHDLVNVYAKLKLCGQFRTPRSGGALGALRGRAHRVACEDALLHVR